MGRGSLLPGLIVKNRRSETTATAAQARMLASTRVRAGVSVLLALFVCSVCAFGRSAQTAAHKLVGARYLNAAPGVGYVGSKACARCHEDIYREFKQTAMGRSMSVASDPRLPRPAAPVKVRHEQYNRDFEIYCEGENLFQSESETAPDGTVVFKDARRIAYALGAGANGIGYIVQDGNRLLEAPLSYYTQTHTWGISPGYEQADAGFDRVASEACIVCHSGRARPVEASEGVYENPPFQELAIGCENCHGPGQLHVEERTKGAALRGPVDGSIVNPADLPIRLANNICMTCHESGDARVLLPGKTYRDFRPGEPLNETLAIFAVPFTPQSPPQGPLLQQYMQMALSRCYLASGGKLACITCHDPHFQPSEAEAPAYYRQKCLTCHTDKSCTLPVAARLRKSDNCIGCHMPRQNLEGISHSSLTNHRIIAHAGEPFPAEAFHMTTAALPDLVYLDGEPNEAASVNPIVLLQAYEHLAGEHPEYGTSINKLLAGLAKAQPDNPLVLSAQAKQALLAGNAAGFAEAQEDLRRAIAGGSASASDLDLYARLLIHSGSNAEAVAVLERDIALHPYLTERYKMLALAYLRLHEYRHALETMNKELAVFPQDSDMRALAGRVQKSFESSPQ